VFEADPRVRFTLDAVRQAARLVRQVQVALAMTKADHSPVTVADFASQALVASLLEARFPNDAMVGEEDASVLRRPEGEVILSEVLAQLRFSLPGAGPEAVCYWIDLGSVVSAERFWTLDPIDGTKGFLRGMQYAVALAYIEDGQVLIGALGCPNLNFAYLSNAAGDPPMEDPDGIGSLVLAVRGQGAWAASIEGREFLPLKVSAEANPSRARLLRSYEAAHTHTGKIADLIADLKIQAAPIGLDSQVKYALLAGSAGDLIVRLISSKSPDYKEKIWDQAAGALIVEEAGGKISDLDGKPLDFSRGRTLLENRGVLASNGLLHPAGLGALQRIGA